MHGCSFTYEFPTCSFFAIRTNGYSVSTFYIDGAQAIGQVKDGDEVTAAELGYTDAATMALEHDWCHHFLAVALGEEESWTLRRVSLGMEGDNREECLVIEFQKLMNDPFHFHRCFDVFTERGLDVWQLRDEALQVLRGEP